MLWKISPRGAATDRFNLGGDVRQHAALGRDIKLVDNAVDGIEDAGQVLHVIGYRVNADHRIARAEREPFVDLRGNALHVIAGIVRLQAAAKGARQADGGVGFLITGIFFAP